MTHACGLGGGAVPCAHFSTLPRTPQAVVARKIGRANWLRPGTDVAIVPKSPANPPAPGDDVTAASRLVMSEPPIPIAVFFPLSRLPIVSPSAPFTWPSGGLPPVAVPMMAVSRDRKSTRLNSSHGYISYAVFCLKKKKKRNKSKIYQKKKNKHNSR